MKYLFTVLLTLLVLFCIAQVKVNGYYRKNGTYVQPHYRSNPDGNPYNNWSYPGNTNPYTGKTATGNPDTYLNNYYNRNSSGSGGSINGVYYNYTTYNLYRANYTLIGRKKQRRNYYSVSDESGNIVGTARTFDFNTYTIYNNQNTVEGYIELNKKGSYTMYDPNRNKLFKVKRRSSFFMDETVLELLLGLAGIVVLTQL